MPNTSVNLFKQLKELPVIYKDKGVTLTGSKADYMAKDTRMYEKAGEIIESANKENPQAKMTEEYFNKLKGFTWYSEVPFFKKVSKTKPTTKGNTVEVTRTNGKGTSSKTNYDTNGIRNSKITQKYDPETKEYDYSRIVYNKKGTGPEVVSSWKDKYIPLDNL